MDRRPGRHRRSSSRPRCTHPRRQCRLLGIRRNSRNDDDTLGQPGVETHANELSADARHHGEPRLGAGQNVRLRDARSQRVAFFDRLRARVRNVGSRDLVTRSCNRIDSRHIRRLGDPAAPARDPSAYGEAVSPVGRADAPGTTGIHGPQLWEGDAAHHDRGPRRVRCNSRLVLSVNGAVRKKVAAEDCA